jgi:hypothetical protein
MNAKKADESGKRVSASVQNEQLEPTYSLLAPVLAKRTPFRYLDRIGKAG